jgi:methylmalonyl-CoA mutase N-terminal domain/subunit
MWAHFMKERFGAKDPKSMMLRFHSQTAGSTLTAQQVETNIVRVSMQAAAAVLGGTQSLHTNGYDEALSLPTADAATLALRTQQVIAYESGVANTVDPLAGSYYVEHLTNELERRALQLLDRVDALGGAAKAVAAGFFQDEIARSAYELQLRVESGEAVVVGVNKFVDASESPAIPAPDFSRLAGEQIARLHVVRSRRRSTAVSHALDALRRAAGSYSDESVSRAEPLMPLLIDAVRARASVGEISDALASEWGMYER